MTYEKKYNYLYKTTCTITKRFYYGMHSTDKLEDGYLGSGSELSISIKKYGKENHVKEILSYYKTRKELIEAETMLITEEVRNDPMCMNVSLGGNNYGRLGLVTVKDKNGKTFSVLKDDPRYLSGELTHNMSGYATVKDKDGKTFRVLKDDPRYLSGELVSIAKGHVTVKDKNGKTISVLKDDPRYLSGELIPIWKNKKHKEETKKKIGQKNSIKQKGKLNSNYGTMWITNGNINKKIKKTNKIPFGWIKGRTLFTHNNFYNIFMITSNYKNIKYCISCGTHIPKSKAKYCVQCHNIYRDKLLFKRLNIKNDNLIEAKYYAEQILLKCYNELKSFNKISVKYNINRRTVIRYLENYLPA